MNLKNLLEDKPVHTSVPCRVDFGGTLDISCFYLPLTHLLPSSFNIALNLRTHVRLTPGKTGSIIVSSRGFDTAEFKKDKAPFDHPMGLMFAVAKYFDVHGVHIHIESTSPPRSALGGSSSAAVAIIAAFYKVLGKKIMPEEIAWLAHYIEASVAGVPCGMQDQLAAAFGGINQWVWKMVEGKPGFDRNILLDSSNSIERLNTNILVVYCGIPHVSKDINKQWVESFIKGKTRTEFEEIVEITDKFSRSIEKGKFRQAADLMIKETKLRINLTPDVLDNTGKKLFEEAVNCDCGARFTGAGGGGCLWAIGESDDIERLRPAWQNILEPVKGASILAAKIDNQGIMIH
jgi:D-glycero-alpha-D-manno-heptose-7-phosphate kinase